MEFATQEKWRTSGLRPSLATGKRGPTCRPEISCSLKERAVRKNGEIKNRSGHRRTCSMHLAESGGVPRPFRGRSASRAKALERIAKNRPLGGFLNAIPPQRFESLYPGIKKQVRTSPDLQHASGGELGIRTPDTLLAYTRLAGEHLRPLGQLSVKRCAKHGIVIAREMQGRTTD